MRLLGVGGSAGLGTAPARGADWQSGRRRPGNGSGFSGGRDPPEEAAAAARAARGERRERRAAAAGAERAHGRSNARPPELRRGGSLCVTGPAWRLLSGLAGAGREPPGLSVPERYECSPLASKVWSRQRQPSSSPFFCCCPDPRAAPASCPRCSAIPGAREASEPWRRLRLKGSFSFLEFSSEIIACSIPIHSGLRRSTERRGALPFKVIAVPNASGSFASRESGCRGRMRDAGSPGGRRG